MRKILLIVFVIAVAGEIAGVWFDLRAWQIVCKPLIMLTLGALYLTTVGNEQRSTAVIMAIVFSLLGDTLLLFEQQVPVGFLLGLGSFLIAHVFYMMAYRQHRWEDTADRLAGVQKIRFAFPIILGGSGLFVILYPVLGSMLLPVALYALVLTLMVVQALFRLHRTSYKSFWTVFTGAVLFMVSDSVLAIDKFLQPVEYAAVWIMLTYSAGQFLIVKGILYHRAEQG